MYVVIHGVKLVELSVRLLPERGISCARHKVCAIETLNNKMTLQSVTKSAVDNHA
mgnify:CR=1 FL=1